MVATEKILYREWQYPRISSFLPLLLFVPAVWIVAAPFKTDAGIFIGLGLCLIGIALKLLNAPHILVTDQLLRIGSASIPRKALGEVLVVAKDNQFFERGANLDARAQVFLKYGLPELLKVKVIDPNDPTPYLLVSSRNAKDLASALA
jgi:hypothetical protein